MSMANLVLSKRSAGKLGSVALIIMTLLSGCGETATSTTVVSTVGTSNPNSNPGVSGAAATLVLWATGSEEDAKVLQAAGDAYTALHPNVTVKVQAVSWDDAHAKILTAATSGVGPDIITGGLSWGVEFGSKGGMIDLRAKYPAMVTDVEKTVQPDIYKGVVSRDNKVFGVPYDLTTYQLYYRTDIVTKAPTTWEELTAEIQKEQSAGKKGFAMQWGNTQWLQYFNFLYAAGGTLYDNNCTKATVNSEAGVKALQYYADLYTKYKAPTDGWPDLEGGLEKGDYGIGSSGDWISAAIDQGHPTIKGKWAMAPLPTGPSGKRTAFIGGRIAGIMSYSKNQDASADFIHSLYSDKTVTQMTQTASSLNLLYIPPRADFADKIVAPADRITAIKATLSDSAGPPNCPGWEESSKTLQSKIQEILLGKSTDLKKALDDSAAVMTQNLTANQ